MTTFSTSRRFLAILLGGVLLTANLLLATAANADDDTSDTSGNGISVAVPSPSPTPSHSNPPTNNSGNTTTGSNQTPPASPAPTEPRIPSNPATTGAEAHVDRKDQTYRAGGTVIVTADGFTGGEQVQVVLYSDPILIGNVAANADGTFEHSFALPDDLEVGKHTIQLTGWQSKRVAIATILVTSGPLAPSESAIVIPGWVWWIVGVAAVIALALAAWWIFRVMRGPRREEAVA